MVLWVATTVLRQNLGPPCGRPTHGCDAGCALASRFLIMIHYGTTPMCYFHVSSSLVISPYLLERSLYQTKSSRASFWSYPEDNLEEQVTDININRLQELVDKRVLSDLVHLPRIVPLFLWRRTSHCTCVWIIIHSMPWQSRTSTHFPALTFCLINCLRQRYSPKLIWDLVIIR